VKWAQTWFSPNAEAGTYDFYWKGGISAVLLLAILLVFWELYARVTYAYRRRKLSQGMVAISQKEPHEVEDTRFADKLDAVKAPEQTIAALKAEKKWNNLAEVYEALNRHEEAAWAWDKAGEPRNAAIAWAKAGNTLKAAKLLEKLGDYGTAARFYVEMGKPLLAARVYEKHGDLPSAASAYAQAGKTGDAFGSLLDYFANTQDAPERQVQAADQAFALVNTLSADDASGNRSRLLCEIARRFESSQRGDLAVQVYREAGALSKAGEALARLRRFDEAAQCFDQAGDCHAAGRAFAYAGRWDEAAQRLMRIPGNHPRFQESRGLLGRCFFEVKDYAHCAAALEGFLAGAAPGAETVDYFRMLGAAYEQLGQADKAQAILRKINGIAFPQAG
jgi:tetratricopeptide (TPR) repeat protein